MEEEAQAVMRRGDDRERNASEEHEVLFRELEYAVVGDSRCGGHESPFSLFRRTLAVKPG